MLGLIIWVRINKLRVDSEPTEKKLKITKSSRKLTTLRMVRMVRTLTSVMVHILTHIVDIEKLAHSEEIWFINQKYYFVLDCITCNDQMRACMIYLIGLNSIVV